nr:immunoglobulin light chain junction region [Macaca mulatta]MOW02278.1 immunoglobulin light chain junction region [Macaca mulatta]MOW02589.1 immunoglobulin light chain junction region [Macaca mulatta]MOW02693.1 immunoglobulin light chain junction region [Macaca mulatta]MOW02852.1 immunoglobulin light chain junction region [Macaca mulatta]
DYYCCSYAGNYILVF